MNLFSYLPKLFIASGVNCLGQGSTTICNPGLPRVAASSTELQTILQIVFGIIAALAVLFVVIGGLRFVLSEGNPEGAAKARSTLIYALIGMVVALSAEAIVTFALDKL